MRFVPVALAGVSELLTISLCLAASVLAAACDGRPPAPPPAPLIANPTDPQWVSQNKDHKNKVAVVFVHGIFGDTLKTWTNDNGETFFRLLTAQQKIGSQVDVFAFGFTSNMFKPGSFRIGEAATALQDSLKFKQVLDYPTIVFVAHSMGGLVVLQDLLTRREMLDDNKVPLVVLYSTPQEGAQIAAIGEHVAKNPALSQMIPADQNGYLQQLNDDWKSLPKRPHIVCAYETLPTDGIPIVLWSSATRFCDGPASPIAANHVDIVKPDRLEHPSVIVLVNALNDYVLGQQLTAKLDTPDFVPEGDHFVFHLSDPSVKGEARLVNSGGSKLTFTLAQISDHLILTPDDTPRDIPARQTQLMHAVLGFGAAHVEYPFLMESSVLPPMKVLVRVDNFQALLSQQEKAFKALSGQISARLADPTVVKNLSSLPAGEAKDQIVRITREAVAREIPEFPESTQLVWAASFLNAANWPQLATSALRQAEKVSPATTRSSSTLRLAAATAAQSGDSHVFGAVETPKLTLEEVPRADVLPRLVEHGQSETSEQLAKRLQEVPALKPYGLSLEGDLWAAKGNKAAALNSYQSASAIGSPSLTRRIKDVSNFKPLRSSSEQPVPVTCHDGSDPRLTKVTEMPWRDSSQVMSQGFGSRAVWVIRLTVPPDEYQTATLSYSPGRLDAFEYQGPPTKRNATLSRVPCDFRPVDANPMASASGTTITVPFKVGMSEKPEPTLTQGETYYLNINNDNCPIDQCEAMVRLTLPRPHR